VRHAKSSWEHPELTDFDRPLNARGLRDAPRIAQRLAERGVDPQRILSSPANRAASTARTIAARFGLLPQGLIYRERIYDAQVADLMAVIAEVEQSVASLLLVGHNPGLTLLAERLLAAPLGNIPTAGACGLRLDIHFWHQVQSQKGELLFFDYPKKMLA
jgi:phosphohistidine phosphatase